MLKFLDTKLTLRHLLVLSVVVMVPALGAGALAAGSSLHNLLPAGSVRMAEAASTTPVDIAGSNSAPVNVLHVSFNVPSGRQADVQATFSASVHHLSGSFAYCFGSFTLDGVPPDSTFKPGLQQLLGGSTTTEPDAVSAAMTGFRKGVGPGSHTVNMYITAAFAGCELQERAMTVLVNIH